MCRERIIRAFAGGMVLAGLGLGLWVSREWLWLDAFVGANLFQWAFTGVCPLGLILRKLGVRTCAAEA
jgi:hypothetical protein